LGQLVIETIFISSEALSAPEAESHPRDLVREVVVSRQPEKSVGRDRRAGGRKQTARPSVPCHIQPPKNLKKKSCHARWNCYKGRNSSSLGRIHAKI
jgi:hypothetical protein